MYADPNAILGQLGKSSGFDDTSEQKRAWLEQIKILRDSLDASLDGLIFFEFVVPRLGRRIDVVLLLRHLLFVIEFKVGEAQFNRSAREQVWDYALDLKNFHKTSHQALIVPVLMATEAVVSESAPSPRQYRDGVFYPIEVSRRGLAQLVKMLLSDTGGNPLAQDSWEQGAYLPTPTIIEAAKALYARHSIKELSRSDAGAKNLARTSQAISEIIAQARLRQHKTLCLVTGVPGAGKTLVGLDVATRHMDPKSELHSVYLSGNGPLVAILREALTRDRVHREADLGRRIRVGEARQEVESFIQNVHHFRDDCLKGEAAPAEHVAIFDEAQRAWNREQTIAFMARKKNRPDFNQSEPEFLISCLDRHRDWAVVICLVGSGQEINTGEAGIVEWLEALERSFPDWHIRASTRLLDDKAASDAAIELLKVRPNTCLSEDLHLSVSMRSFRAENLSSFVRTVLDLDLPAARTEWQNLQHRYPIRVTRDLDKAKCWLREQARGSERFGMVVSSQAARLKPLSIDVRVATNPVHWFLHGADDVRSSFYLEDVATEFDVQGLELDWACVVWDADLRYADGQWSHHSFVGNRWNRIRALERQVYQKNAYRVLLTRARQGMVLVVPEGNNEDATRLRSYYDGTYTFLRSIGLTEL
jgi:hypothetical protein